MSEALRITAKKEGSEEPADVVFLCHNSRDKPFIRSIADALELEFGTRFFLDVFAIPTGEAFIPWIEKALEECAVCAIFLGANGWGPTHLWEAELALARYRRDPRLRIIPVALPGIDPEQAAKLGSGKLFQDVNWADFTKGPDDKESLDKLEAALTGRRTLGYRGPARLTPYQMRRDAERWEKSARKDMSILYGGRQLIEAERMARDNPDAVVVAEITAFLSASRERQSSFWRRIALASATTAALLLTASVVAALNYVLAEERRLGSVSRQLAMAERDAAGADRVMLVGARAVLVEATPEANGALLEQLQEFRFLRRIVHFDDYIETAALGPEGRFFASSAAGVASLSIGDKAPKFLLSSVNADRVTAMVQGPDGVWLGYEDGRVDIVLSGRERRNVLAASGSVSAGRERKIRSLAYDETKKLLAAGTGSGRVAVIRLSDGRIVYDDNEGDNIRIESLSFDPTRSRLAIGTSEGTIELLDTDKLQIDLRYPRIGGGVLALGYTQTGSLAAVGREGRMFYFDRRNPELESPTTGDAVPLATSAVVDAATARIAVGDSAGVVRLFDAATGQGTGAEPLRGHSDAVTAVVFGKEKNDLISASSNGTVAIWDLSGGQGPSVELPQSNPSPTVIRPDVGGALIAAGAEEGRAEVRKLVGEEWLQLVDMLDATRRSGDKDEFFLKPKPDGEGFTGIVAAIPGVVLSDDGGRVAWFTSGGGMLAMKTSDVQAGATVVRAPRGPAVQGIAISGDGRTLAAIEDGGMLITIQGLDPVSARGTIRPPVPARSIALSRDGSALVVGMTDGRLVRYRSAAAGGWTPTRLPWKAHNSEVAGLEYSPDADLIVSYGSGGGGSDRAVTFSNASGSPDPRRMQSRQAAGSVSSLSVGTFGGVAAGDHDGQVLRWSTAGGRFSGRLTAGTSYVSAVLVDDAGRRLVTASGDGSIRSWPLDAARWVSLACLKANRDWKRDEWLELLPDDTYVGGCSAELSPSGPMGWWRMLVKFLHG